ncbi:hypothetical protein Rhal01_00350 [Rubritalea halochordaticola]|uniref:FecR protein domain-containing protein n=1 Tax=Rubritalea halochordaticola TaxID=714537 RepID=A0ABP9UYS6_9BACT
MTCPELHKNIQSYLDGTLPAEQEEALVNTLLEDPQARSLYMRYAEIDTLLADAHEGTDNIIAFETEPASVDQIIRRQRKMAFLLSSAIGIAASLLLGAIFYFITVESEQNFGLASSHGTIYQLIPGDHDSTQRSPNSGIQPGDRLVVEQGCVEVKFPKNHRAIVQAPADFTLTSENTVNMSYGKIWVETTEPGFIVNTPEMKVTDLGTVFGVTSLEEEADEVHVISGKVRVESYLGASSLRQTRELHELESLISNSLGGFEKIDYSGDAYLTELPEEIPYIHYSFDRDSLTGGKTLHSEGILASAQMNYLSKRNENPRLIDGIKNEAVQFTHQRDFMISTWKGIPSNRPRTVMMWVKLRKGLDIPEVTSPTPIILWGSPAAPGNKKWKLGLIGPPDQKKIRVSLGSTWLNSDYALSPGKWHHLAVTFTGGSNDQGEPEVNIYVDGQEIPWSMASRVSGKKLLVDTIEREPLQVGGGEHDAYPNSLQAIDELYIFEGVLDQKSVRDWMNR